MAETETKAARAPKTQRIFNGAPFDFVVTKPTIDEAREAAQAEHKAGYLTRIVRRLGGLHLYRSATKVEA